MGTPMKLLYIGFFFAFFLNYFQYAGAQGDPWKETVTTDAGAYTVKVLPEEKKVEIKRASNGADAPPYLRMRVARENDRPLEVHLKALATPGPTELYTGRVDHWNQSYTGVELDFSFDKKTWKRLGRSVKNLVR